MTKFKISLIGATVVAGAAVSMVVQHRARIQLLEKDQALRLQDEQLAKLTAEQQGLSNQIAMAQRPTRDERTVELVKLRDEAERLRMQIHALRKSPEQRSQTPASQTRSKEEPLSPEYYEQIGQMMAGKAIDARNLAAVLTSYASDHDQFPTNLDMVAPYLNKQRLTLTGTNEFDIVYLGSFNQLKKLPLGSVAVVRTRQTVPLPDGRMARVYGMADSVSQMVVSDDNFKAWEAEHLLPPPKTDQP